MASKSWRPLPGPQTRALSLDLFETLFGGARGGGKTDVGIVWLGMPAVGPLANPQYRGLVIRLNYVDLCDWIDRAFQFYRAYGATKSGNEFRFPNGAVIRCGHLKDADAYVKYQGHEYHRVLIEELTQIPREEDYLKLIASCRSTVPGLKPAVFCTTNPGNRGHSWVKRRFLDAAPSGKAFRDPVTRQWRIYLLATLADNPYLGDDYRAQLAGLPEHLREAWLHGNWDVLAGQYFSRFREADHVVEPFKIPAHWEKHCSIDWGFASDPYAVLFYALGEDGTVYVYREMTGHQTIPADVARRIIEFLPNPMSAPGDPSMWAKRDSPDSTALQLMSAGLYALRPAVNDRIQGWTRVHEYLERKKIKIFNTCRELLRCLPAMIHDESNPEDALGDSSIDHLPDALRYFLMSRPLPSDPLPIEPEFHDAKSERAWRDIQRMKSPRKEDSDW